MVLTLKPNKMENQKTLPISPCAITPEGVITPLLPKNKKFYTLEELQEAVEGYIEIVPIGKYPFHGRDVQWVMVLNEEGKLKSKEVNSIATFIYRKYIPENDDFIVGTVLVCPSIMVK